LAVIDQLRDEYGQVPDELPHPYIASGRPWPPAAEPQAGL
jgi:hypothetical protein